jgi:hypothetical protein
VKNRRSLTPSTGLPSGDDVHATRRGGARHDFSARVTLRRVVGVAGGGHAGNGAEAGRAAAPAVLEGWALNISRGGIRVILEEKVDLGDEYEVVVSTGADPSTPQVGRIVWMQEEPDGVVAGIEFRPGEAADP